MSTPAQPTTQVTFLDLFLDETDNNYVGTYKAYDSQYNMAGGLVAGSHQWPIQILDSDGLPHNLILNFLKTGIDPVTGADQWNVELYAQNASEVANRKNQIAAGRITFNNDGSVHVDDGLKQIGEIDWSNGASTPFINFDYGSPYETISYNLNYTQNGAYAMRDLPSPELTRKSNRATNQIAMSCNLGAYQEPYNGYAGEYQPFANQEINSTTGEVKYTAYNNLASNGNFSSNGIIPNYSREFTVFDESGKQRNLQIGFLKVPSDDLSKDVWSAEIYSYPPTAIKGGSLDGQIANGNFIFDHNTGLLTYVSPQLTKIPAITWVDGVNGQPTQSLPVDVNYFSKDGQSTVTQYYQYYSAQVVSNGQDTVSKKLDDYAGIYKLAPQPNGTIETWKHGSYGTNFYYTRYDIPKDSVKNLVIDLGLDAANTVNAYQQGNDLYVNTVVARSDSLGVSEKDFRVEGYFADKNSKKGLQNIQIKDSRTGKDLGFSTISPSGGKMDIDQLNESLQQAVNYVQQAAPTQLQAKAEVKLANGKGDYDVRELPIHKDGIIKTWETGYYGTDNRSTIYDIPRGNVGTVAIDTGLDAANVITSYQDKNDLYISTLVQNDDGVTVNKKIFRIRDQFDSNSPNIGAQSIQIQDSITGEKRVFSTHLSSGQKMNIQQLNDAIQQAVSDVQWEPVQAEVQQQTVAPENGKVSSDAEIPDNVKGLAQRAMTMKGENGPLTPSELERIAAAAKNMKKVSALV